MTDGFDPAIIESRIRSFESFGVHRTGWPGDDATSEWLVAELRAAGIEAELERFTFPRVECRTARLTWPDGSAGGLPLYDGGFTPPGGIEGQLVAPDDGDVFGGIVVAFADQPRGDFADPALYERLEQMREAGAVGLVLVGGDASGDLVVRNAERIDRPAALPALQVAPGDAAALVPSVLMGAEATLEIDAERLSSSATNVVATLPGAGPQSAPVGIMTPKSGWFTCAAERGGGIAIWLALAEALAAMPERRRPLHLVASSGHELHYHGLASHFRARPDLAAGAVAWLRLGASIGAREPRPRMAASDEELLAIVSGALADANAGPREPLPAGSPGLSEARNISQAGGRYVSLLGGHALSHSPNDTVDRAVDAESVARHARAALTVVEAMLALPLPA